MSSSLATLSDTSAASNLLQLQGGSREEILRRQLAARRRAKEPAPESAQAADLANENASRAGLSIKGKGRAVALSERIGGMRGWDEVPASRDNGDDLISLPGARTTSPPARETSVESSLAYPRSPSARRSSSPRRVYRNDESSARCISRRDGRERSAQTTNRAHRDRSASFTRQPSRSPRRDERHGGISCPRRHSPSPHPQRPEPSRHSPARDKLPDRPPLRTFDNPERLAMRQGRSGDCLPHHNQRYDPRRNAGGPIQAEPMRAPDPRERRPSPQYNAYERPPHLADDAGPQSAGGSGANGIQYGYGSGRRDLASAPPLGQQGQGGGEGGGWQNPPRRMDGRVDFEQRRLQRESSTIIAWPASPKQPYRDDDEIEADRRAARKASKAKSKSKKTKQRSRYSSASSSDSDDAGGDRRGKRGRSEKRLRYSSSDSGPDVEASSRRRKHRQCVKTDSESEEEKRRRRKRESKSKSKSRARSVIDDGDEDWAEKSSEVPLSLEDLARTQKKKREEEEEIGPILPGDTVRLQQRQRYEDMRPGEGEAMALYASNGMRIPRRGEIGIDTERIQNLEGSGYVMSGARNKKMNAMRLRKENQVINAEEKRAILNLQREEKIKKEGMIVSQFRELMNTSIQRQG